MFVVVPVPDITLSIVYEPETDDIGLRVTDDVPKSFEISPLLSEMVTVVPDSREICPLFQVAIIPWSLNLSIIS